jgi:hypothetical protein
VRYNTTQSSSKVERLNVSNSLSNGSAEGPLFGLARNLENIEPIVGKKAKVSSFPEVSDRNVAIWLLASAASVFGIVVFGGLTRLTESGYVIPGIFYNSSMFMKNGANSYSD